MPIASLADLRTILPELILATGGVVVLLWDAFLPRARRLCGPMALGVTLVAFLLTLSTNLYGPSFGGLLEQSRATVVVNCAVLVAAFIALLASEGYLVREDIYGGEYHALLLWSATGLMFMSRAVDLITLFVALELASVALYSLVGYHRRLAVATEGALKYFLNGAFISAFVLYGIALVFGETGSTRLADIQSAVTLGGASNMLINVGLLLLVAGFCFKMSVAPFHAWSPDAYQGGPSPYIAFLSVAPKAASAVVLIRVLQAGTATADQWSTLIAGLAVLSMLVGNLLALSQRDIKRLLAYSGIAHMGYLLVPLAALDETTWQPVLVYVLAYTLMNAGAFAAVAMLYRHPGEQHLIEDLAGWGYRFPWLAAALSICMLSLAGIPPTLGFLGKYLVFLHAISHGQLWLALAIVFTSLVGVYYYLRIIYVLYMKPEVEAPEGLRIDLWGRLAAAIAVLGTILLGLLPARLLDWISQAGAFIS